MAYSFIAGYNGATAATVSGLVVSAGQSLIILAGNATTQNATLTVADGTNSYAVRGTINDTFNGATRTLIDCLAPTPGTYTLTLSGGGASPQIIVLVYTGLASYSAGSFVSSFFGASPPTNTDGCITSGVIPTSYSAMIIGLSLCSGGTTLTQGTLFSSSYSVISGLSNGDHMFGENLESTQGFTLVSFTASGTPASISMLGAAYIELEPTITVQPASQVAFTGQTATFNVTATTSGGALSYQWQQQSAGTWSNVGTNSTSYTTGTLGFADSQDYFRVLVTDSNGVAVSNTAILSVGGEANAAWWRA